MTQTIIGHDNTDNNSCEVVLETTEGFEYIFCKEYDYAHGVTTGQSEILITGSIAQKRQVVADAIGDDVDGWFNAVQNVEDIR